MATEAPTYDRTKVLTGLASMYLQPYVPATPPALPPDTQALNTAWAAPWTPVGATVSGLELEVKRDTDEIMIEEQPIAVDVRTKTMTFTANVELAQDTLQTMKWAYGGGTITTVAATTGVPGVSTLKISDELEDFAFGFEGVNEFDLPRRVMIPIVKSVGNIKTAYQRSKSQRSYQTAFQSLCAPGDVVIKNIDAPAL